MSAAPDRTAHRWRPLEATLLALASGIALTAAAPLGMRERGGLEVAELLPALLLATTMWALHGALVWRGRDEDPLLLPITLALLGIGLAFNARLAPALAQRQQLFTFVGVAALALALLAPYDLRRLRRFRHTAALLGLVLVALTLAAGRAAVEEGPRLWLGSDVLGFQPAEALKPLVVLYLSATLVEHRQRLLVGGPRIGRLRLPPLTALAPMALVVGTALLLLAAQGDLGAALLLVVVAMALLYLGTARRDLLMLGTAIFAGGAWLLHRVVPVVRTRTALWLDPWGDPRGAGFQLIQALMAMSAGGLMGTGVGFGQPTVIPAVHTDFVYAAIVEEMGMAGAAALLALYGLLLWRGLAVAMATPSRFVGLLVAGLSVAMVAQAVIIVGGDVRLLPLTGITLPLVAHGGSSMVVSTLSVGLILHASARPPPASEGR